ncbi:hypothetical protein [Oscillibacter sp.]|uniref:hypothetical protein n=1 Tax=Oscillibacter sp. TaxID=1945593 RepID=UPI00339AA13A
MDDLNVSTTGESVTEQTPTTIETLPAALPDNYLADGYHAVTEKGVRYRRPEYVDTYARQIAALLAPMKPSDFNPMLREMKRSNKGTLPFEARQTAAYELRPAAISLVRRKRAPKILIDFIEANLAVISTDADWTAFYRHLLSIQGFMSEG